MACQHNVTHEYRLYYPAGYRGRAEPIRMLLEELNVPWREPWTEQNLIDVAQCLAELDKMRPRMAQQPFGLPVLECIDIGPRSVLEPNSHSADAKYSGEVITRSFFLAQTPIIMHYLATVISDGQLLVQGTPRVQHEAAQLAEDIDDCFTEAYYAWMLLAKSEDFVSPEAQVAQNDLRRWWTATRFPRWIAHFDRFLFLHNEGNYFLMGERPCYLDLYLFPLLEAFEYELRDVFNRPWYERIKAYHRRLLALPGVDKRLKHRKESFTGICLGV